MNKVIHFFKSSYQELSEHITWLTWTQLQKYSLIILVFIVIFSLVVWGMDSASSTGMKLFYSIFRR